MGRERVHKLILPGPRDTARGRLLAERMRAIGADEGDRVSAHLADRIEQHGPAYYYGRASGRASHGLCRAPGMTIGGLGTDLERCPECGSGSYRLHADGRRTCRRCRQEWRR